MFFFSGVLSVAICSNEVDGCDALRIFVFAFKVEGFVRFLALMAERTFTASLSFISLFLSLMSFFCFKWVL